jgi:hypothetical protein
MRIYWLTALAVAAVVPAASQAACCYFSAKNADILQPAQKVFITWDPEEKVETFTVQPKFEGNALDFGMVIPTPSQPKLSEMPRDFFKNLAVYTIMKQRQFPRSKLIPNPRPGVAFGAGKGAKGKGGGGDGAPDLPEPKQHVIVLESGLVGSLDYKIIEATRADALFQWLKDNKYSYAGDEATLNYYVQKKWLFTVMKIDTMQMKRNKDGTFSGDVTPTRFQFASEKLIYPLKITQISVREKTEALFYVQAPFKVDLPGDLTYQYQWVSMLQASGKKPSFKGKGGPLPTFQLPGKGSEWLEAYKDQIPPLLTRAKELGFVFVNRQRPGPNGKGHIPTTMEWARKLTKEDVNILTGKSPYSEKVPDPDEGFTRADINDPDKGPAAVKVIRSRIAKSLQDHPKGYLVRYVPDDDVKDLQKLAGHLTENWFITKFRKIFARDEMNDDLTIVPARYNGVQDNSEYEEMLPVSPP